MGHAMTALVFVSLLPLGAGCKTDKDKTPSTGPTTPNEEEENALAEDGTDSNAADTDAQLLASTLVTATPGNVGLASFEGGELTVADVGDSVKTLYLPRSCVEGKATGPNEGTYTFTSCTGPNGLLDVTGTVVARFSAQVGKAHLDLTYTDLKVNGASIDGSATADIVASGVNRTMTWGATLDGTTRRGKSFGYQNHYTVSWTLGEACFSLDGTTEGQVRNRDIKTEVKGFKRCRRGCPEPGGKITVTNVAKNKVVTIDFDGTAKATFTAPNGKQFPLPLACKE